MFQAQKSFSTGFCFLAWIFFYFFKRFNRYLFGHDVASYGFSKYGSSSTIIVTAGSRLRRKASNSVCYCNIRQLLLKTGEKKTR